MTVRRTDIGPSAPTPRRPLSRARTAPAQMLRSPTPQRIAQGTRNNAPVRNIATNAAQSFWPGATWASGAILAGYTRVNEYRLRTVERAVPRDIAVHAAADAHNVRIWETRGHGPLPTLVVLHGMGGAAATHRALIRVLSPHFRKMLFVEVPGHGASQPVGVLDDSPPTRPFVCADRVMTTVRTALDEALHSDDDILLLGHSLGGYLAARYANESARRDAMRGIVLVSPDGGPYSPRQLEDARAASYVGDSWIKASAMARNIWPNAPLKAQGLAPFLQATYAAPAMRYLLQSDLFQPALRPQQLQSLPPTCLIWGTAEAMQLPEHLGYFREHLPSGTHVVQPEGLSHGDFNDAPESMVAPLRAFFMACVAARPNS